MKLSVVIPSYNEAGSIPDLLLRFSKALNGRDDIELILVDNGSTDCTQEVLKKLILEYGFLKVKRVEVNRGYGFGILSGLKVSQGEYLSWTHADLQTDPADVLKALNLIEEASDSKKTLVKGMRKGRLIWDRVFTFGMSVFESLYFGVLMQDINAQPVLFHRSFFESWVNPPYEFSLDLYAYYQACKMNFKIQRFPVLFAKRVFGSSHWNKSLISKFKFIKRTLIYSMQLKGGR